MVFTNVFNPRSEIPRMEELNQQCEENVMMGVSCTIVCVIRIGRYSCIGAGAVVTKDVPDYACVIGTPARISGWVCECGVKLSWKNEQALCACGHRFVKTATGLSRLEVQCATEKTRVGAQRHEIVATSGTSPV